MNIHPITANGGDGERGAVAPLLYFQKYNSEPQKESQPQHITEKANFYAKSMIFLHNFTNFA